MVTAPASARMATLPMTATRSSWTTSIVQRRSSRSARPPATRPNRTIGTWAAIETPAISAGDLVSPTAISGIAISEMPSARFAAAVDAHSRQKFADSPPPKAVSRSRGPRGRGGGADTA